MMTFRRTIPVLVLALLALSALACALPGATDSQTAVPVGGANSGSDGGNQNEGGANQPASGAEATPAGNDDRFIPVPGGVTITQTTPESGNGEHPTFAWEPVDGAARYMVNVYHADGGGYWSWEGETTEVMLGGFDAPPGPDADGPRLTEPMTWAVLALDADDHFIASSPLRSVAP